MISTSTIKVNPPNMLHIERFKGINRDTVATQIEDNQAEYMLNYKLDSQGSIEKRFGYTDFLQMELGSGVINGIYNGLISDNLIFQIGTNLYSFAKSFPVYGGNDSLRIPTTVGGGSDSTHAETRVIRGRSAGTGYSLLKSGLSNAKCNFFMINSKLYLINGTDFIQYSSTVKNVNDVDVAYIPTLILGKKPDGTGGTVNEQWNLIGTGFKESFSGDNASTVYYLSFTSLDATEVSVTIGGVAKTEGTHFTVNRTNGTINFSAGTSPHGAPITGTNNVVITAYKTYSDKLAKIKGCKYYAIYGGANDTRIMLSGNSSEPNVIYRSAIGTDLNADPTYFPENTYSLVGNKDDVITGFAKQYDALVIFKYNSIYSMSYSISSGVADFPIKPINDSIGCIAPRSIQLIDNSPVFLSKKGVYQLTSSNVRDERNVQIISNGINSVLTKESNLANAVSIDFDKKYILRLNDTCYIYDYAQGFDASGLVIWYLWDNINANCFAEAEGRLYFGSDTDNMIYKFSIIDDERPYHDNETAINAIWRSKYFGFNSDAYLKYIEKLFYKMKPFSSTSVTPYYATQVGEYIELDTTRMDLIDFGSVDFENFSFETSSFPQEVKAKVKQKKVNMIQVKFENDSIDESIGILSLDLTYKISNEIK